MILEASGTPQPKRQTAASRCSDMVTRNTKRCRLGEMLFAIVVCFCNFAPAQDLSDAELELPSQSLREVFEEGGFFEPEDEKDSLAELLREAREIDESVRDSPDTDDEDETDEAKYNEDDSNPLKEALGESDELDDEELEEDQLDKEAEALYSRQRVMIRHLQKLQKPIRQIRVSHATSRPSETPTNRAAEILRHQPEILVVADNVSPTTSDRYPAPFAHRPLYFEEIDLERCGQHYGCAQNFVSALHFLTNAAALPYRLATQRPDCAVRTRGDCRSCQTFSADIEPFVSCQQNASGLVSEAASVAGFVFLML